MAIIDTLFMTKTAEKPYPLGPHIPQGIVHVGTIPTKVSQTDNCE